MLSFQPLAANRLRDQTAGLANTQPKEHTMVKLALFVRLEAKPGQEAAVAAFSRVRCRSRMPSRAPRPGSR